jgi:hypothetical protein
MQTYLVGERVRVVGGDPQAKEGTTIQLTSAFLHNADKEDCRTCPARAVILEIV